MGRYSHVAETRGRPPKPPNEADIAALALINDWPARTNEELRLLMRTLSGPGHIDQNRLDKLFRRSWATIDVKYMNFIAGFDFAFKTYTATDRGLREAQLERNVYVVEPERGPISPRGSVERNKEIMVLLSLLLENGNTEAAEVYAKAEDRGVRAPAKKFRWLERNEGGLVETVETRTKKTNKTSPFVRLTSEGRKWLVLTGEVSPSKASPRWSLKTKYQWPEFSAALLTFQPPEDFRRSREVGLS